MTRYEKFLAQRRTGAKRYRVSQRLSLGLGLVLRFLVLLLLATVFTSPTDAIRSGSFEPSEGTRPELVLQRGHSLGVTCAAFAADGSWLASGGSDNSVIIWQLPSGRQLRTLAGHTAPVRAVAINANGDLLASAGHDRTIKIWNVSNGSEVFTLSGHTGTVNSLAFSPKGEWLVSGSSDKTVRVWNLQTRKQQKSLSQPSGVDLVTFSRNGATLASSSGGEIRLWETTQWQDPRLFRRHAAPVTAIVFSKDDDLIASSSADGTVLVWKTNSDHEQFALKNNPSPVTALAFQPQGDVRAVHANGAIESWDTGTGQKKSELPGNSETDGAIFSSFSNDASVLAFGIGERKLSLRNTTNGLVIGQLQNHSTGINSVAVSGDGRWFAAAANDGSIRLWQIATGRELPRLLRHAGYVTTVAFSHDSRLLASGSRSGEIKVWDMSTAQLAFPLPTKAKGINIVAFSPDGKTLAAGGMDHGIEIWDLESKQVRHLSGHTDEITSLVFVRSIERLISSGRDKTIRMWDFRKGAEVASFNNNDAEVNCLAVSSDGNLLAAANTDNTVRTWKISDPASVKSLTGHSEQVLSVSFHPKSNLLASGGEDHKVILWNLDSGKPKLQLSGISDSVTGVTFSEDGKFVLSSSDDGSVTIWSQDYGELKATLVSTPDRDDWLVTAPDGLFDGSPESWNLMLWRFAGSTFNVMPVEAYFNEFYYPGLLADILASKDPKAAQDIAKRDRRQPQLSLKVSNPDNDFTTRNISVELEVRGVAPDKDHPADSGAKDVRLFRNGLLIKKWSGDVLQQAEARTLRTDIQIVAGENRITAYAFNRDNIKSLDATLVVNGASSLRRQGAINLLVIGVEQYENPRYNLKYPVADADEMNAQLRAQQERLGKYKPIITISLTNAQATKRNILLALARLAGTNPPLPPDAPKVIAGITPAQPEDAVVVYFSGHGTALRDRFYLIPHDMGYTGRRESIDAAGLTTIVAHSISDEDLVDALQPLDVDQLLVIIDSCNSGQALESNEKRRGPMNTKGLAQLAYEKGIYVLTASQSIEVAFEADALKHSYLAYALLQEGIKNRSADENRDGDIFLKEWFEYANRRVPEIRRTRTRQGKELVEDEPDEQKVQRPRVFYTRESGASRFLVAQHTN